MRAWPRSASACNTPSREPARLGSGLVTFAYYANIPFNSGFVNSQIRFQMAVGSGAFRPVRAFRDRCDLDCRLVDPKPLRRPNIGGPVSVVVPELQIAATIDCFNAPISRCWPCRFTVRVTVIPRLRPGPAKIRQVADRRPGDRDDAITFRDLSRSRIRISLLQNCNEVLLSAPQGSEVSMVSRNGRANRTAME